MREIEVLHSRTNTVGYALLVDHSAAPQCGALSKGGGTGPSLKDLGQ